jgi:hypothetical protein
VYECFVKLGLRYICVTREGRFAGVVSYQHPLPLRLEDLTWYDRHTKRPLWNTFAKWKKWKTIELAFLGHFLGNIGIAVLLDMWWRSQSYFWYGVLWDLFLVCINRLGARISYPMFYLLTRAPGVIASCISGVLDGDTCICIGRHISVHFRSRVWRLDSCIGFWRVWHIILVFWGVRGNWVRMTILGVELLV